MKAGVARRIADMVANGLQPEVTKIHHLLSNY